MTKQISEIGHFCQTPIELPTIYCQTLRHFALIHWQIWVGALLMHETPPP